MSEDVEIIAISIGLAACVFAFWVWGIWHWGPVFILGFIMALAACFMFGLLALMIYETIKEWRRK